MKKVLLVVAAALALPGTALAGKPVPSLTPAATAKLWRAEVAHARTRPRALADDACRPARVIFYAQTDWLRLATRLAAQQSPCAQYYISIPPLSSDKSQARPKQAALIRALGPNFHALDEISWNGWNAWVNANNSTWYQAGVTARQRMAAAGFDASAGDTWALNELSSAVRAGTGAARTSALEFLRGLSSDGVKGVVFSVGMSQTTPDLTSYKVALQSWLTDDSFWTAASQYVSDFAQENYGDLRAYAVAGSTPQQRRDTMVQYLGHMLALANANPNPNAPSRTFMQSAYVAFGNAAWAWSSAYGFTSAALPLMEDFVSGQVYADRALGAPSGVDRFGFAWAPNNSYGLAYSDYVNQTAAVIDRLAAAIRDSGVPSSDPGSAACAPSWCTTVLPGAVFTTAWQGFSTWTPASLGFVTPPTSFTAGSSTPVTVQLQTSGVAQGALVPQTATFASTSPRGTFSTSAAGPWTPTLAVTIPAGVSSATVYYSDTAAGTPTISAALGTGVPATETETVTAGPVTALTMTPATATVKSGATVALAVGGVDAYGNVAQPAVSWALSNAKLGRLTGVTGQQATFAAGATGGQVVVTATQGTLSATATLVVTQPPARVASVRTASVKGHLVVTVRIVRGTAPASGVVVTLRVRKGSSTIALVKARTGVRGRIVWRSRGKLPHAHYVAKALVRTASTASRTQQPAR